MCASGSKSAAIKQAHCLPPVPLPLPPPSHSVLTRFCVLVVAKVLTFAQICSCSFTCLRYFSLCRRVAAAAAALSLLCRCAARLCLLTITQKLVAFATKHKDTVRRLFAVRGVGNVWREGGGVENRKQATNQLTDKLISLATN